MFGLSRSAPHENGEGGRIRTRFGAVLDTAALPMSYTLELVLTSGVEPESPGSQPSTLPLSYISMVPMG